MISEHSHAREIEHHGTIAMTGKDEAPAAYMVMDPAGHYPVLPNIAENSEGEFRALFFRADAPSPQDRMVGGDNDHMIQIKDLISQLEAVQERFGNTCVYIRRGGMGWGAVALNRRDDDQKNGVFDLQAQHDRDMQARLEQIGRLRADREEAWRQRREAEGSRDAAYAAADSLRTERDALRKALEPFAEEVAEYRGQAGTPMIDVGGGEVRDAHYTIADLRRARKLLLGAAASEGSTDV